VTLEDTTGLQSKYTIEVTIEGEKKDANQEETS